MIARLRSAFCRYVLRQHHLALPVADQPDCRPCRNRAAQLYRCVICGLSWYLPLDEHATP